MAEDEMYSAGFRTNQVAPSADGLNMEQTSNGTVEYMHKTDKQPDLMMINVNHALNDSSVMRLWPVVISSSSHPKGDKIANMARIARAR